MSKAGVFTGPSGVIYRDRKRHLWFSSLFVPAIVFVGPALYFATQYTLGDMTTAIGGGAFLDGAPGAVAGEEEGLQLPSPPVVATGSKRC